MAKKQTYEELGQRVKELEKEVIKGERAKRELSQKQDIFLKGPVVDFKWAAKENWPAEYVSPNVTQFGYRANDFLSSKLLYIDIIHPEDLERVVSEVQAQIESGIDSYEQEYRIIRADGEVRWVYDHTVVHRNDKNEIMNYDGYVIDNTKHKQAEEALREREEKYRQLFEKGSDAVLVVDAETLQFEGVNKAALDLFGYSKEELLSLTVRDTSGEPENTLNAIQKVKDDDPETKHISLRHFIKKDGSFFFGEISSGVFVSGGRKKILSSIRDISERRRAEKKLRESEEKYRNLFDNAIEGIFQTTPEGRYISVNPALVEIYGYKSPEDLINNLTDIERQLYVDQNSRKKLISLLKKKDSLHNFESQVYRKDGSVIWTSENIRAVRNELGELINYEGSVVDISSRKQSEEALHESEERFRLMFDTMSGFALLEMMYDESGKPTDCRYVEVNPAHEKLTGLKSNEIIGRTARECIPGLEDSWIENYGQVDRTGKPMEIENYVEGLKSCYKVFAYRPIPGFVAVTFENVTDSKRAEEALKESEEKYRLLVGNASDAILIAQDEIIKFSNKMTEKLIGYSADELEKMPFSKFIHPNDRSMVLERYKQRIKDETPPSIYTFRIVSKEGEELWVEINSVMLYWEGRPATLNIIRDISENKKLESQLQQAQKMEAIGTLAGGIAHDFNNLLMGIQGRTSLMLMHTTTTNSHYEHLKGIEDYVESAAGLTKQLLGFARGGKYEVKPTDLNELIKNQNRMFGRTKKEITIRGKYEKDLWAAEVDQVQIEQVLLNLYVNAWQSMPGGGDLYIQTENITLDENYTKPFEVKPGKYVKISVTDTGVGMDEATRQRIFDPFFTTKEMGRGTGLGLATVYGIIKNHEGFINVYSEKGEGTTFNIYLPASEKEIIEEKELAKDVLKGTETVLLVDDENVIIYAVELLLKEMGYKTFIARSGKETVKIYKKNKDKIDVVILDMTMPDMGGGETYDRLKEINPDIKVLLSSGYSINGQATEILERGCNGFIQKPYRRNELSQKIREVLDKD